MSNLGKLTSNKDETNAAMDAAYAVYLRLKAALAGYPRTSAANPRFQNDFNGLEAGFLPLYQKVKQDDTGIVPWIYFDDKAVSYNAYFTQYLTDFTNAALALGEVSAGGGGSGGGGGGGGGGGPPGGGPPGGGSDNTMLYAGIAIAILVGIYLATKPKASGMAGLSRRRHRDRRGRFV